MSKNRPDFNGSKNPNYKDAGHHDCVGCGTHFMSYQKTRKYCSFDCYNISRRKPQIKKQEKIRLVNPCPYCGKGNLAGRMATCGSVSCREKHEITRKKSVLNRNRKFCEHCGTEYYSRRNNAQYCSHKCHYDSGGAKRAGRASIMAKRLYGNKKDANHHEMVGYFEDNECLVFDLSDRGCGVPDLLVGIKNIWYLVEIKNPGTSYGKKGLNKLQEEWADKWQGGPVYIVRTEEDCKNLIDENFDKVEHFGGYKE